MTGTGIIGSVAGLLVVTSVLVLAVQLAIGLLATSSATAAGHDAVRRVAARHIDHADPVELRRAQHAAETELAARLGIDGRRATFQWHVARDRLTLTMTLPTPQVAPDSVHRAVGLDGRTLSFSAAIERVP